MTDILKTFKVLFLDADGVFFTGTETRGVAPNGEVMMFKTRHHHDGQGISFLRALGIRVVFVSGEGDPLEGIVQKLNLLPSAASGAWAPVECFTKQTGKEGKVETIEKWLAAHGFEWADSVYIGDDHNDCAVMERVAFSVCPSDACRVAKNVAKCILAARGGNGAIREFAEQVLDARGVNESTLPSA